MRLLKLLLVGTVVAGAIAMPASAAAALVTGFAEVIAVNSPENFVGNNATGSATAFCPAGTQLVGGGGRWNDGALQWNGLAIVEDLPEFSDRWSVTGRNASGSGASIHAVALCGIPGPNHQVFSEIFSSSTETLVNDNSVGGASKTCKPGTQSLSGGASWRPIQRNGLSLVQTRANPGSWVAVGRNNSGSAAAFTVVALCGRPGLNGFIGVFAEHSPENFVGGNNATGSATATCPSGTQMIGGGGFFGSPSASFNTSGLSITASSPFGPTGNPNSWTVTGRNSSGDGAVLIAIATCGVLL